MEHNSWEAIKIFNSNINHISLLATQKFGSIYDVQMNKWLKQVLSSHKLKYERKQYNQQHNKMIKNCNNLSGGWFVDP